MNSSVHDGKYAAFKTFEDLPVYQQAREFRKAMYCVAKRLPDYEKFGLASQIRRASVSLTNNLAEGHGRYHYRDQLQFVLQARGSLEELVDDLNVCIDEKYLQAGEVEELRQKAWQVHHLINGYGRYLRERKTQVKSVLHDAPQEDEYSADFDVF